MAWVYLFIAGIFEIVWAIGLKYTNGFTRLWPTVVTVIGMIISFYYLSQATKVLPIGTAYTIWTGIGAAGAVILGIILFGEPKTLIRFVFLAFVITGIIGLKVTAGNH
ncbi:quaternary ammonium compound efflux SMR transporter SugE [Fictibacillus barbaricus]|jgi:quaternary ammonium compound-resistance protein SugE|uniref:Quaternary ammonium compound efflux SMR transporter SugE n=1 Tax=Fictibacillus barbaricus TaxID=182136 RepID=A0ABS2ZAX8_9BACL|nr:quaternary ammonium compound efflux SMR transporter SugE [Fictibacillus barbaricus]MBN3544494.1 quaternary ammonium compound efflux SMR transporter SugE [Fictibacillus barbaricus]GGB66248.1 multidrug transporter [Fictibacillus barbaricus]